MVLLLHISFKYSMNLLWQAMSLSVFHTLKEWRNSAASGKRDAHADAADGHEYAEEYQYDQNDDFG